MLLMNRGISFQPSQKALTFKTRTTRDSDGRGGVSSGHSQTVCTYANDGNSAESNKLIPARTDIGMESSSPPNKPKLPPVRQGLLCVDKHIDKCQGPTLRKQRSKQHSRPHENATLRDVSPLIMKSRRNSNRRPTIDRKAARTILSHTRSVQRRRMRARGQRYVWPASLLQLVAIRRSKDCPR